jgi:hypothetical protein
MPLLDSSAIPSAPVTASPVRVPGLLGSAVALLVLLLAVILLDLRTNRDLGFIVAGAAAIQLGSCRRPRELLYSGIVATLVLACFLAASGHAYASWTASWTFWVSAAAGALGVGSLAVLSVRTFGADDPAARFALKWASLIPVFALVGSLTMQAALNVPAKTFDVYLYKFDDLLGFPASFRLGSLFLRFPAFKEFETLVYDALGMFPAIVFAAGLRANRRLPFNPLTAFVLAGTVAFALYQICPGTAPISAFPGAYPNHPPAAGSLPLEPIAVPDSWRNAMPSMHVTWALLAWSCSLTLQRWVRAFCTVFLALTCLATLGLGQHYLADLIVACSFTVAVSAACCVDLPWSAPARWHALTAAGCITLGWLILLRLGWLLMMPGPVAWLAVLATVTGSAVLQTRLLRAHQATRHR